MHRELEDLKDQIELNRKKIKRDIEEDEEPEHVYAKYDAVLKHAAETLGSIMRKQHGGRRRGKATRRRRSKA